MNSKTDSEILEIDQLQKQVQNLEQQLAEAREVIERFAGENFFRANGKILNSDVCKRTEHALQEAISHDISERKRAEEMMQRSQRILSQAEQMAHLGAWESPITIQDDIDANRLIWSDEVYRMFGYEPGEVEASNELFFSHIPEEDRPRIRQAVAQAIAEHKIYSIEHRIRRVDGTERIVHEQADILFNPQGFPARIIGAVQDITERKQAEALLKSSNEALRDRNERLTLLSEAAGELLRSDEPNTLLEQLFRRLSGLLSLDIYIHYRIDDQGKILEMLSSAGLSTADQQAYARLPLGQAVCGMVAATQQRMVAENVQQTTQAQTAIIRKMGLSAYVCYPLIVQDRLIGTLSFGSRQRTTFSMESLDLMQAICDLVAIAIDRKRAEMDLREYAGQLEHSNHELQEFAFVASHDLQEPLRKIEAFGELLLARSSNLENRQRDQIERMIRAAIRMRGMVEGLLNLSRLTTQAHPFEQVNLSQVASEVLSDLEMQIQRTGARIEVGNLPAVEADPMQMHQLLQNLIANALKFHRKGGAPVVKINASDQRPGTRIKPRGDHQQSLVTSPQPQVIILIEDNGIGFDEQYTARMFQPFQRLVDQREYEGSGMGLAICRKIVLRHGGKITARNQPGGGAVFAVTLPVRQNRQV